MRTLIERPATFEYSYNMKCSECPEVTSLTSDEYHREDNQAHVKCHHCSADIHFGPAVMALRDIDDPALDETLTDLAWYHTSTEGQWPSGGHLMSAETIELLEHATPADAVDRARYEYEDKALHLGTYGAAIESMLRRMIYQDDGGSQFYLYRVALRRDELIIAAGSRDENLAEAAQITQSALGDVDVIRYLNVHESPGSVSLAVRREAIAWIQRISLPADAVDVTADPEFLAEVARIREQIERMEVLRPEDTSALDQIRARVIAHGVGRFTRSPTPEQSALSSRICRMVEDAYLPGVSKPVRARFGSALSAWRAAQQTTVNDDRYIDRFAQMAVALTHPADVLQLLDRQAVRVV